MTKEGVADSHRTLSIVMAGHSRPEDGVASLAYVPAIHALLSKGRKTWMPGTRPGMTGMDSAKIAWRV
jgi:hypothetical protein